MPFLFSGPRWKTIQRSGKFTLLLFLVAMLGLPSNGGFISPAHACPPGTIFSVHWKGQGVCARPGRDGAVMAQCKLSAGGGKTRTCPTGTALHNTKTDPGNFYCCPNGAQLRRVTRCSIVGKAPFCNGSCKTYHPENRRAAEGALGCAIGSKAICCAYVFVH